MLEALTDLFEAYSEGSKSEFLPIYFEHDLIEMEIKFQKTEWRSEADDKKRIAFTGDDNFPVYFSITFKCDSNEWLVNGYEINEWDE